MATARLQAGGGDRRQENNTRRNIQVWQHARVLHPLYFLAGASLSSVHHTHAVLRRNLGRIERTLYSNGAHDHEVWGKARQQFSRGSGSGEGSTR